MKERLKQIRLLLLDVDGVLTDGRVIYDDEGLETKFFNVKDGLGIRLLIECGLEVGIITGRASRVVEHRCADLGIRKIYQGEQDKVAAFRKIIEECGFSEKEVAYVGDDLPDLPLMELVGLPIAVADAHRLVRERAFIVTRTEGGRGAVREVCEMLLEAQGFWDKIVTPFLSDVVEL
ncbi:MAG: phenylphosphate carboxylase subunit delta [Desulfobacterales bacterium C00003106]|nr:MAG: phenylphosphate carboxylase subunit delta [Desulfobacterales bacterium C00003106]OEU60605.1 MAG: phenylphosphate carboxylase subunit delta [Desulfobacterales bacterium C00003104]